MGLANSGFDPENIPVVCAVDDLFTDGYVLRRSLSARQRMVKAGRLFAAFFGFALISVFIPLMHFILPPLSLLIGGTLAYGEYMSKGEILDGEITCPNCRKVMRMNKDSETWPKTQRCTGCAFTLKIERKDQGKEDATALRL